MYLLQNIHFSLVYLQELIFVIRFYVLVTDNFGAGCRYEPLDNKAKKLFIVDSGLAFNSPYPLLLRPQRAVDIYLSFDFSQRPEDKSQPFKELLLAERWAIQNKVPFPPIEKQVRLLFLNNGKIFFS